MDGPDDYVEISFKATDNHSTFFKELDKQIQPYQLLIRNERYMAKIKELRQKYNVGAYELDGSSRHDPELPVPSLRDEFEQDTQKLAKSILFPGDWEKAVRDHVLGYTPEACLFPEGTKRVLAKTYDDHIEVRFYGDLTQPELREAMKQIRDLIDGNQSRPTDTHFKRRYRLNRNLAIYDLHKQGWPYRKIAAYCHEKGLRGIETDEDVSKYIQLTKHQIENIVA